MLVGRQCLDEVEECLRVGLAHLVDAHVVGLRVVLAILTHVAQGCEVVALVFLGICAVLLIETGQVAVCFGVGLSVVHDVLDYGEGLGQGLVQSGDNQVDIGRTCTEAGKAAQAI